MDPFSSILTTADTQHYNHSGKEVKGALCIDLIGYFSIVLDRRVRLVECLLCLLARRALYRLAMI